MLFTLFFEVSNKNVKNMETFFVYLVFYTTFARNLYINLNLINDVSARENHKCRYRIDAE